MFTESTLRDQVALVTGASRGIGQAIAKTLAEMGATVIGTATSESGAEKISEHFSALNLSVQGRQLNVDDVESTEQTLKSIADEFGAITILVNNAGITRDNLMMRMKQEDWDAVIDTNLSSAFRLSKQVMRGMMKARQGRIINMASVVAASGNPGQVNYAASKAGLIGFSKSMAKEVASRGITVNVVAPGFIQTDMTDKLGDEQKTALLSAIPAERLGSVDDIAAAVAFLSSPTAAYITGETLHVNGGMYMA